MNHQPSWHEQYASDRFKHFPHLYFDVFEKIGIDRKKPIRALDIGCGPGNWTLALAKYNPHSQVIGLDIDPIALSLAKLRSQNLECNNVDLLQINSEKICQEFDRESFDYVFTMSALQYLNERKYFENISHILRTDGKVLIFWTHHIGYYIHNIPKRLIQKRLKDAVSDSAAVILGILEPIFSRGRDHVITYETSRRIALKYGIELQLVAFSTLCHKNYQEKFLNLPYVFNMLGRKKKRL